MTSPPQTEEWRDVCRKCAHRGGCKRPCRPVEMQLAQGNLTVFEKTFADEKGEPITILFPRSREFPRSALLTEDGKTPEKVEAAFSTEGDSPFAGFAPGHKQTGIFIDRLFHRFSYADLVVKYDMTPDNARKTYYKAKNRVRQVVDAMDGGQDTRNLEAWKKAVEMRSGRFPKNVKWFLLNKLFGMRPSEIAKMEGVVPSGVRSAIARVADSLSAGKMELWKVTPEEVAKAKSRLEAQRARRRQRYTDRKSAV